MARFSILLSIIFVECCGSCSISGFGLQAMCSVRYVNSGNGRCFPTFENVQRYPDFGCNRPPPPPRVRNFRGVVPPPHVYWCNNLKEWYAQLHASLCMRVVSLDGGVRALYKWCAHPLYLSCRWFHWLLNDAIQSSLAELRYYQEVTSAVYMVYNTMA